MADKGKKIGVNFSLQISSPSWWWYRWNDKSVWGLKEKTLLLDRALS